MKTEGQSATEKLRCQKKKALKHFVARLEKVSQRDVDKALSLAGLYGGKKDGKEARKREERIRPPLMLPVVDMKRRGL